MSAASQIIAKRRARSNSGTRSSRTVRREFDPLDEILILLILENYHLQTDLEAAIAAFVEHYNNRRSHESLGNLIPTEVYFGHGPAILAEREKIKKLTIQSRRLNHLRQAAKPRATQPELSRPTSRRLSRIIRRQALLP